MVMFCLHALRSSMWKINNSVGAMPDIGLGPQEEAPWQAPPTHLTGTFQA